MEKIYSAIILFALLVLSPAMASAATLSLSPASGNFEVGDRIAVKVIAGSATSLNAVSGTVSFPTSLFSVDSVSKAGSIIDFWVTEPSVSKTAGIVKFEGVALGGWSGSSGTIATIYLRATKIGTAKLAFLSGQILANDGAGTDITGSLRGAAYTIKVASIKPPVPEEEIMPEEKQPEPTLRAPEIMLGTKYGAPAILGTSEYGKAQTLVTLVAQDGAKVFITGVSDNEGEFSIIIPNSLKRGVYSVEAVMIKSDKTNSEASNIIKINVGNIFSDIGKEVWGLIALLVLAVLYLLLRIYFHLKSDKYQERNNTQNKNLEEELLKEKEKINSTKEELHKAEDAVHKSFKALRDDVADRSRGIVNPVERENIEELRKDLDSTEQVLAKEIKDIEKLP